VDDGEEIVGAEALAEIVLAENLPANEATSRQCQPAVAAAKPRRISRK
jgi:hypothetical protein